MAAAGRAAPGGAKAVASIRRQDRALRSLHDKCGRKAMSTNDLRGHVALVTGGSRGIGAAIVKALGEAGCAVAINYRERAAEAETLAKDIVTAGGKAVAIA